MTEPVAPVPQPVLAPLTESAVFLTLTVAPGGEAAAHDLLPELGGIIRSVGFRMPEEELTCVLGIGSDLWDRIFTGPRPAHLHPFRALTGARHHAPATPGDLFLHVRARRTYPCFELARRIVGALGPAGTVVDEVQGFRYFDRRDLLGFVDGTENPTGPAAAGAVLATGDGTFDGGSYLVVQKYLHDLDAWNAMTVEAREHAVGRTQLDDVELADRPTDSHVGRTDIEGDILRDNMPFGSLARGEFGTFFAGYAADPAITETMLRRMFLGEPEGSPDRILEVSTAVTGALFYVPTADFLDAPPPLPTPAETAEPRIPAREDLGIGGLRLSR